MGTIKSKLSSIFVVVLWLMLPFALRAEISFGDTYSYVKETWDDDSFESKLIKSESLSVFTGDSWWPMEWVGKLAIEVRGVASKDEIRPVVEKLSTTEALTATVMSDGEFRDLVMPTSSNQNDWTPDYDWNDERALGDFSGLPSGYYKPTSYEYEDDDGGEYLWPMSLWPNNSALSDRFWVIVDVVPEAKSNHWYGMSCFRVWQEGTGVKSDLVYLTYRTTDAWPLAKDVTGLFHGITSISSDYMCLEKSLGGPYGVAFNTALVGYWMESLPLTVIIPEAGTLYLDQRWASDDYEFTGSISTESSSWQNSKHTEDEFYKNGVAGSCTTPRTLKVKFSSAGTITINDEDEDGDLDFSRLQFFPASSKSVAIEAAYVSLLKYRRYPLNSYDDCVGEYLQGYVTGTGVYKAGETVQLTAHSAPGEEFDHWELKYGNFPDGIVTNQQTLSFVVTDDCAGAAEERKQMVVKAVWKEKHQLIGTPNDIDMGSVTGSGMYHNGENVTLTAIPEEGFRFLKWSDDVSTAERNVPVDGDAEFVAIFQLAANIATITFDANGGEVSEQSREVVNGDAIGELPTPTRSGYVFDGWWTAVETGEQVMAETLVSSDATYIAKWIIAPTVSGVSVTQYDTKSGKVDVEYTLAGDIAAAYPGKSIVLRITATDRSTGDWYEARGGLLSGDTGTDVGIHHVVWDMGAQGLWFQSEDVVFTVAYEERSPLYCVIDLSAGATATSYPVSYLADIPSGGWSDEYKTTKLVLRRIDPGTFMMCGKYDVTLTKPYYVGVFEVTQKQYELVMGGNPSQYNGDMRPVECVSWNMIRGDSSTYNWPSRTDVDPNSFVGRIQARTGLNLDLPTEAQWEYACRAGTSSVYNNGGDSENDLKTLGRYSSNRSDGKGGYSQHAKVGSYQPNEWGLYDMHGNIWEWCCDRYGDLHSGNDPLGSSSGANRVGRGGCWINAASECVSSHRGWSRPSDNGYGNGFRVVVSLSDQSYVGTICASDSSSVAIDLPIMLGDPYCYVDWTKSGDDGALWCREHWDWTDCWADAEDWAVVPINGATDDDELTPVIVYVSADESMVSEVCIEDEATFKARFKSNIEYDIGHTHTDPNYIKSFVSSRKWLIAKISYKAEKITPKTFFIGLKGGSEYRKFVIVWNHSDGAIEDGYDDASETVALPLPVGSASVSNNGSGARTVTVAPNAGYAVAGWSDDETNTSTVRELQPAKDPYYVMLGAGTVQVSTVTFDTNGGYVSEQSREVVNGDAIGELPTPTRSGYVFDGWWTAADGGEQVLVTTLVAIDATYYAHWVPIYVITWLDGNGAKIDTTEVVGGYLPIHSDSAKEAEKPYSYTFSGWTPAIGPAESNTTYRATFAKTADLSLLTDDWTAADGDVIIGETARTVTIPGGATVTINGIIVAGGSGAPVDVPSFSESGESAVTKFEGAGNTWTFTAFAEMEGDSVGTAVSDGQIKVYAADSVEGLKSAEPVSAGVTVTERKSAVKTTIKVVLPSTPEKQFFKVKFGE